MTVGEKIKTFRKERGLSQEELGKMCGLSGVAIMRYEKGQREPRQQVLTSIAKALNIHLRDLADTSLWEEFDRQHPELIERNRRYLAFRSYLEEAGYSVQEDIIKWHWDDESEPDPSKRKQIPDEVKYTLIKGSDTAIFTDREFEGLQAAAREAIEGKFYKKVLEQQKKQQK